MPTTETNPSHPADRRRARLFRNGRNQAVRIPREFEFQCEEVFLRREADHLLIEPARPKSPLLEVLAGLEAIDGEFPDVDAGLPPLDDIKL